MGVIRRNLGFSLVYNATAISLAMAGWMHPVLAAVAITSQGELPLQV